MPVFVKSKLLSGIVKKISGNKTLCVVYSYTFKHKKYKKNLTVHKKYLVHDEKNECSVGDKVSFCYYRPISSSKSHILYKKIS